MSLFNPFTGIIETENSPHAHVLRTGLLEKCALAFRVYFLGISSINDERHVGVFDWLTGFIPLGLLCFIWAYESENPFIKFVVFPVLFIINLPLILARVLFACAATLATSLLVIPIVHFFAWLIEGRELKRNVGKLIVADARKQNNSLEELLGKNGEDIANLQVKAFTNTVIKKYEFCAVSELPDNPDNMKDKIYLSENGDYCVSSNGQLKQGSLVEATRTVLKNDRLIIESYSGFNHLSLKKKLEDKSFKRFFLDILHNRSHIEGMSVVYFHFRVGHREYISSFFRSDLAEIDEQFNTQKSAVKSLLRLNPNQITKDLEQKAFTSKNSDEAKVLQSYMHR